MQKKVKILGVRFDNVTMQEALQKALRFASQKQKRYICTPNPEILLEAQKNRKFLRILNDSALNIPDGFGIILASKYKKAPLKERVTGTDLMREILAENSHRIFLLGAHPGIAEEVAAKFPNTNIVGTFAGSPAPQDEHKIRKSINDSEAEILFVAYGAPAQELWIARNLKHLKPVNLAIGVGGAFDFLAGKTKRAPLLMRKTGLEWLYRLAKEPKRVKRIYNAVIKFPIKIISS
jgi:N-acetylglucosaminyldiphosphoundecaprenol N-acetyl-beta-D-mannosaminyltransferase